MQDRVITAIVSFTVGALFGGYIVGKACGRKHREVLRSLDIRKEETESEADHDEEEEEAGTEDDYEFDDPFADEDREEQEKIDYQVLSRKYHSSDFDEHFADRVGPTDEEYDPDDIYLIDEDQFTKEISWRDDEQLTYYQKDDVLVDLNDHVISDIERTIGLEALDEAKGTEKDQLYISNDVDDKLYEVIIEHVYRYHDIVGGVEEDEVGEPGSDGSSEADD